MADIVVFEILLPCTEDATGVVHAPEKFDDWVLRTAQCFGGVTVLGIALRGLWYDTSLPAWADPVEDHSNWYRVGVPTDRVAELRTHAAEAAREFGQKCVYFRRSGEADFVWNPDLKPGG